MRIKTEQHTPEVDWLIASTDHQLGNRTYVYRRGGRVSCELSTGIPASLFYAGVNGDEAGCMSELENARTAEEALAVMLRRVSTIFKLHIVR